MKKLDQELHFDNYRQIKIIKLLIDQNDPIPCNLLARHFQVSQRLIREDIKALKSILRKCNVLLLSKRGMGYYLDSKDVDLESMVKNSLGSLYYYDNVGVIDKFAREQLILRYLVLHNKALKPQEIMDEFYISRTTLKKDLERAKETIEHYPIALITRPYQGIYLEGSELGKRMLLNRETAFYKDQSIFHMLNERIEMNGITIEALLCFVKEVCNIEISNVELFNLYSHMNIMLLRVSQKQYVNMDELEIRDYIQPLLLQDVKQFLNRYQDLSELPDAELYYFCLLILSSGYHTSVCLEKIEEKVKNLLKMLQKEIKVTLFHDEVSKDIARIWLPLEIKSVNSISSSPLLVRDIKKYKPEAVDIACKFSSLINSLYHIKLFDNDICALSHCFEKYRIRKRRFLRILVVSARGSLFTEGILLNDLKRLFPEESFIYCDLYDLEKQMKYPFEFMITDVSLTNQELIVPVSKVDFFNVEKSVSEIKRIMKNCRVQKLRYVISKAMLITAKRKEDVLYWYANLFEDEEFYQMLLNREETLTIEVNKRIAIICVYGCNKPSCFVKFSPFYWKNAEISYAMFVNISSTDELAYLYEDIISNYDELFMK